MESPPPNSLPFECDPSGGFFSAVFRPSATQFPPGYPIPPGFFLFVDILCSRPFGLGPPPRISEYRVVRPRVCQHGPPCGMATFTPISPVPSCFFLPLPGSQFYFLLDPPGFFRPLLSSPPANPFFHSPLLPLNHPFPNEKAGFPFSSTLLDINNGSLRCLKSLLSAIPSLFQLF